MPSCISMTGISFCLSDRCSGKVEFLAHLRAERSIAKKGGLAMLSQEEITRIKELRNQGMSLTDIARELGHTWRTVRKWAGSDGVRRATFRRRRCKPERDRDMIMRELCANLHRGKNAVNGKRLYKLMSKRSQLGYSMRTLQRYIRKIKRELHQDKVASVPLQHEAGCAQIDFGTTKIMRGTTAREAKFFVMAFPYSGYKLAYVLPSENQDCLLYALKALFEFIGCAPRKIRIDNASTMVDRVEGGGYKINDRFRAFVAHYGVEIERCNPSCGNEKGCVERAVQTIRADYLSPPPVINKDDFESFNSQLLRDCGEYLAQTPRNSNLPRSELWVDDKDACNRLPDVPFKIARVEKRRTDNSGKFTFDGRWYSSGSQCRSSIVNIEIGAFTIGVFTEDMKFVVMHKRCYYGAETEVDYRAYIESIKEKPRALLGAMLCTEEQLKQLQSLDKNKRDEAIKDALCEKYGSLSLKTYAIDLQKWSSVFHDKKHL